ncbi:MAG: D-inositol-3-phosphate glycosyltransferase [Kineosporiaceae bacterium]
MSSPRRVQSRQPRRIAMLSVHTSPLDQPGTGDAGGMNAYVAETARRLAERGTEVEIFTRATSGTSLGTVELAPGVRVRHVVAGPFEGLSKYDLPGQLCAFASGVLRVEARQDPGWYDLVHSHYWLSGQVGWLTADRWHVPLVHTMHTMAKVKNLSLAEGDTPEPAGRVIGEEQVVGAADRLVANTAEEARQLVGLYAADPGRLSVVPPGVDLEVYAPRVLGGRRGARQRLGLPVCGEILLFVGRIQPLKAPDVLVRAAARMLEADPGRRERLTVVVLGGPSGTGLEKPRALHDLAAALGVADVVRFHPPVPRTELADWYRAADAVVVPSHSESFGLVAVEAQACGTPVVAARVGGLPTVVDDGVTGLLVDGHDPAVWGDALRGLLDEPLRLRRMAGAAASAATRFGWDATVDALLHVYEGALADRFPRSPAARVGRSVVPVGDLAVAP